MYSKNKGGGTSVSSDAQAREKLALYVYEYLIHIGAQKAAQTFLSEIRWEKNITLGEPPGFLHFWWCVFWDLYCAAPERCDTTEQGNKPKPFHDYTSFVNGGYNPANAATAPGGPAGPTPPMPGMGPPTEGIPCNGPGSAPGPAAFYPNNPPMRATQPSQQPLQQTQQTSHQMMSYMGPRYPSGPRPGPRMMMGNDYTGNPAHPAHPSMMSNGSDTTNRQMPGGMNQMNSRINAPPMGAMGPMGPRGPPVGSGVPFMGMVPPGGGRPQWQPNTSSPMNNGYPSASPGNYAGAPGSAGHSGPGTPTIPSPREAGSNHGADNLYGIVKTEPTATRGGGGGPGEYGSNQGPDNLYSMVKTEPTRGNGGPGEYGSNHSAEKLYGMVKAEPTRGNSGPGEYGMGPARTSCDGNAQIRGIVQNSIGSVLSNDSLANSPASGPATPRNVTNGTMNDFGLAAFEAQGENGQMESAAILKIKESMQEEAKRFEKGSEQSDFFMR